MFNWPFLQKLTPHPPKNQIFHASWYVRYPVILKKFHLNPGTGGHGQHKGGDGIIREYLFRKDLTLSILTERRVFSPYGLNGDFFLCLWFKHLFTSRICLHFSVFHAVGFLVFFRDFIRVIEEYCRFLVKLGGLISP